MSETISPAVAPVEAAPVVAPAVVAPVADPVVVAAPAVETAAPVAEAPAPVAPATVLGEALTPVAPVVAPEAPVVAPIAEGQSVEPAPPPSYEPFTLPDGVVFTPERIGEFTNLLGEFEGTTKADHAAVQAFGQQLIERHVSEVQRAVSDLQKQYVTQWDAQKTAWKDSFLNDPEIGGNRFQTTVDSAIGFIRTHGGTDAQQAEFQSLMESSGLGNHPAMIRILAKAGAAMSEGRPLAANAPAVALSKTQKLYGQRG